MGVSQGNLSNKQREILNILEHNGGWMRQYDLGRTLSSNGIGSTLSVLLHKGLIIRRTCVVSSWKGNRINYEYKCLD